MKNHKIMPTANTPQGKARAIRREATEHLFTVGQTVRPRSGFRGPFGLYRVTGALPPMGNSPQYRIRSDVELHERVAAQDSLEPVCLSAANENAGLIEKTFDHGRGTKQSREGIGVKRRDSA